MQSLAWHHDAQRDKTLALRTNTKKIGKKKEKKGRILSKIKSVD